jgi:hypothetical protein
MPNPGDDLRNTEANRNARAEIAAALQELLQKACRRGVYAELVLTFKTKDGTIIPEFGISVNETRKVTPTDPSD